MARQVTRRNRLAVEPVPLSDSSRLLLRTVVRTLEDNTAALDKAIEQVNANTQQLLRGLARELAERDKIDPAKLMLDVQTEQWVAKPEESNGKMA